MTKIMTKIMTKQVEEKVNATQAMLNAMLADKAKRFLEIKRKQEELKAEKDALKEELVSVLKSGNLNELQIAEYKLLLSEYDTISLDEKAFKQAEPASYKRYMDRKKQLTEKYTKTTHIERFDVK